MQSHQFEGLASGAAVVYRSFAEGIRPAPDLSISDWSAEYRYVANGASARPGKWSNDVAPYLTEVMECLSPEHPCERITLKKSAQVGGTEVGLNLIGYCSHIAPCLIGYYLPSNDVAKKVIKEKFDPMVEATPILQKSIKDQKSRDENGSTTFFKAFTNGGGCSFDGVNASSALQTVTRKVIIKDDLTEWPFDVEGRGDPDEMADKRTNSYSNKGRKIFAVSVPGLKGSCRITAHFEAGDQRHYFLPCPDCGHEQTLEWPRLIFNKQYPYEARYQCEACGVLIDHYHKTAMLAAGRWIAQKPEAGREPSFTLNQLYSPFVSWDDTVSEFLKSRNDPRKEKVFCQQVLGEAYEEKGDAPDDEKLFSRREPYKLRVIPPEALLLTGAADVQKNRIEWAIYAWGEHFTSWLVDKGVIEGDTADSLEWKRLARQLNEIIERRYPDTRGNEFTCDVFGIDAGYNSDKVYQFVRMQAHKEKVFALDGRSGDKLPPLGTPTKQDIDSDGRKIGSVMLWPVGTWGMKSELYSALRKLIEGPNADGQFPPGTAHYPEACDVGYFRQLTAEHFAETEKRNGYVIKSWVKLKGQANEAHDIAVYARALAHAQLDPLSDGLWQKLKAQRWARSSDAAPGLFSWHGDQAATSAPAPTEPAPNVETELAETQDTPRQSSSWLGERGKNWFRR